MPSPCCLWRGATRIKCSQKSNSKPAGSSLKSFSPPQPPPWWTNAATTSLARLDSSCFVLPSKVTQATKSRWAPGPVESSGVGAALSPQRLPNRQIGWPGGQKPYGSKSPTDNYNANRCRVRPRDAETLDRTRPCRPQRRQEITRIDHAPKEAAYGRCVSHLLVSNCRFAHSPNIYPLNRSRNPSSSQR